MPVTIGAIRRGYEPLGKLPEAMFDRQFDEQSGCSGGAATRHVALPADAA
jgi:hypothetical protein